MLEWILWELVFNLHVHGGQALPYSAQIKNAVSTFERLADSDKVWYFNRNKLDVGVDYLVCLSTLPMLACDADHIFTTHN